MGTISFGSEGIKLYESEEALKANDCIIVEPDWLADAGIALSGISDPAAFVAAAREQSERIALMERQMAVLIKAMDRDDYCLIGGECITGLTCGDCIMAWSLARAKEGK